MQTYKLAEFPDTCNTNFLIVDRLIHLCTNRKCKDRLASEGKDITLNKCLDILRQHESVKSTMQRICGDGREEASLNAAYRSRDPTRQSQKNGRKQRQQHSQQKKECTWCGGERHKREDCPAKDASCDFCNKKGHFQHPARLRRWHPCILSQMKMIAMKYHNTTWMQ